MPAELTRSDALTVQSLGFEVQSLVAVGTVDGVKIEYASAKNGIGIGHLRLTGGGKKLSYKAPGSTAYGQTVDVPVAANYIVEDSTDIGKYLRVVVNPTFAMDGEQEVRFREVYNNGIGDADLTAAEASAGNVKTYIVTLRNVASTIMYNLRVWLDATTANLEISDDGIAWVTPTTESAALQFGDLQPCASVTLNMRRTIAAAAGSNPKIKNQLHTRFDGMW